MMTRNETLRIAAVALLVLAAVPAAATDHRWAGRTLNSLEWSVHQELTTLPFHGVFDSLKFEVDGSKVTLSGYVLRDTLKTRAERAVSRIEGVTAVENKIEVLPSSRRDDVLRQNVYRAIYERGSLGKYAKRAVPPIHIVVKEGRVMLEGVVDTEADRAAAYVRALKASATVTNNLRVAPEE